MPGLMDILNSVAKEWKKNKEKIVSSSESILSQLDSSFQCRKNRDSIK